MLVKKIGIEFELILFDVKKNSMVFPQDYGFSTDEFIILAESRVEPGTSVPEIMGNFYTNWYTIQERLNKNNLDWHRDGYLKVSPEFYAGILRRMGGKEISTCRNLYKTDILKLTDAIVENGVIKSYYLSAGLHLHFSLQNVVEYEYPKTITIKNKQICTGEYFKYKKEENVLPIEWMRKIIRAYDKNWLKVLTFNYPKLKFRHPGFYEYKSWGFEYRSLPFSEKAIKHLPTIISDGFKFLDQIKFV